MEELELLLQPVLTITVVVAGLWALHWLLLERPRDLGNERKFPRQLALVGLTVIGLLAIVFSLPVSEGSRNQLISLVGLVISGIVAFSSTTIFSNLMAGILLRMTKPFRTGDFIQVAGHFGRVTERGLFDTEMQTEARELVALPNILLVNQTVTTIRSSGTLVSVTVTLGYDVHRSRICRALIKAGERTGLADPFVHILELGNFSVTYRVSGLLTDIKTLITTRSALHEHVLDCLHEDGIEIVSPSFMNQRPMVEGTRVIPQDRPVATAPEAANVEEIAFDKAEEAEQVERTRQALAEEIKTCQKAMEQADEAQRSQLEARIKECREQLAALSKEKQ